MTTWCSSSTTSWSRRTMHPEILCCSGSMEAPGAPVSRVSSSKAVTSPVRTMFYCIQGAASFLFICFVSPEVSEIARKRHFLCLRKHDLPRIVYEKENENWEIKNVFRNHMVNFPHFFLPSALVAGPLNFEVASYNGSMPSIRLNPFTWTKVLNALIFHGKILLPRDRIDLCHHKQPHRALVLL